MEELGEGQDAGDLGEGVCEVGFEGVVGGCGAGWVDFVGWGGGGGPGGGGGGGGVGS